MGVISFSAANSVVVVAVGFLTVVVLGFLRAMLKGV
jgi:hypothetical protein